MVGKRRASGQPETVTSKKTKKPASKKATDGEEGRTRQVLKAGGKLKANGKAPEKRKIEKGKKTKSKKATNGKRNSKKEKVEATDLDHQEDEGDNDSSSEKDSIEDENLYCLCQTKYTKDSDSMLACDLCEQWYHIKCQDLSEQSATLLDRFICKICQANTEERSTYKTKCKARMCNQPSLLPLSKFCSDRCGAHFVLQSLRVEAGLARGYAKDPEWLIKSQAAYNTSQVRNAKKCDHVAKWITNSDDAMKESDQAHWETCTCHLEPRPALEYATLRAGLIPGLRLNRRILNLQRMSNDTTMSQEVSRRTAVEWDRTKLERVRLDRAQQLLEARTKLLEMAAARVTSLANQSPGELVESPEKTKKPKKKREAEDDAAAATHRNAHAKQGHSPCGYDERLGWDDETLIAYLATPQGRQIIYGLGPLDGEPVEVWKSEGDSEDLHAMISARAPKVCVKPKGKCTRHHRWQERKETELASKLDFLGSHKLHSTQCAGTLTNAILSQTPRPESREASQEAASTITASAL